MKNVFLAVLYFFALSASAQVKENPDYLTWSNTRRLTVADFQLKPGDYKPFVSYGQYVISYASSGLDFMSKNLNNRVHNYFVRSASWIDSSHSTRYLLNYEQALFDIAEIYARRFRRELRNNRKKSLHDAQYAHKINADIMAAFAKRRLEFDAHTKSGHDLQKLREWEMLIRSELQELKAFAVSE